MDIAAVASNLQQMQTVNAIQVAVLKKAMDIQAQSALALLEALPPVTPSSPAHLGSNIDTTA